MGSSNPAVDLAQVRALVARAVQAATAPHDRTEQPIFPGAQTTEARPTPRAGLTAALAVVKLAEAHAYRYAVELRGEGTPWREIADLLDIPWRPEEYARPERAYELVGAAVGYSSSLGGDMRIYWKCAGPLGCGNSITDRGPYNGHPSDNEDGHADGCQRLAAEDAAYQRERDEQEERARVMDEAAAQLGDGSFGMDTVRRAHWVTAHGGQYRGWSTSETLAVALALVDTETLEKHGYPTREAALQRIMSGMSRPPADPDLWLATVRAAATGKPSRR